MKYDRNRGWLDAGIDVNCGKNNRHGHKFTVRSRFAQTAVCMQRQSEMKWIIIVNDCFFTSCPENRFRLAQKRFFPSFSYNVACKFLRDELCSLYCRLFLYYLHTKVFKSELCDREIRQRSLALFIVRRTKSVFTNCRFTWRKAKIKREWLICIRLSWVKRKKMRIYHSIRVRGWLVNWFKCFESAHEIRLAFEWWKVSGIFLWIRKDFEFQFKGRQFIRETCFFN